MKNLILSETTTFKEAIQLLDSNGNGFLAIINEKNQLVGILTDGDIRRAVLNNKTELYDIMNSNPMTIKYGESRKNIIHKLKELHKKHMPIVDENMILKDIVALQEDEFNLKPNWVVIMAGGLGTRLGELTKDTPKPMLKVGAKPMVEHIIDMFVSHGFTKFMLSVNYKAEVIKDYFGDGSNFGVNIEYILEKQRMGTAGALSLLKEKPIEPFFVMNGDILTNVNFEHLYNYHLENKAIATMCVREYDSQVPYGVVNLKDNKILSIEEKPIHKFFVSAGIYMLNPEVLDYIPKNKFFDMPNLFDKIIKENKKTISFPLREYWLDIGRIEEYKKANEEYDKVF